MDNQTQTVGLERRREDYGLITGLSHYVDDLRPPVGRPQALHMVVVRSPYAHAKITQIQLDRARSLPGVIAVFEGAELVSDLPTLDTLTLPGLIKPERHLLALDRVRYVGDPIAVVVAEKYSIALDARDLVDVEYELLPAVTDPEKALQPDSPRLYDELGSNMALLQEASKGDIQAAFAMADHVVHLRLVNQRLAPSSLEPRGCLFDFNPRSGELSAWMSAQAVFRVRNTLARFLSLDSSLIKVLNAEVGGAFGAKNNLLGEEIVAALLAVKLERPIKWIEDRSENLQAQSQGRGQINYIEAAFQNNGKLLGLKVHLIADLGAFLTFSTAMVPSRIPSMLCGPYQLLAVESKVEGVLTNKATTAPYRGAGRPEAAYILERTMDRIAHELALDPAEVRLRNFISPQDFPYTTVTGLQYDSGNYRAALDRLLELADYTGWRAKQREYRKNVNKRLLGLGLSTFVEMSGDNATPASGLPREAAMVRIRHDDTILVQNGVSHNGQGHFTTFAQIVATTLGVPVSKVEVHMNNTTLPGFSIGTYGSRVTQVAGSAVLLAAKAVRTKALHLVAELWETTSADLDMADGRIMVRGVPTRTIELSELARLVEEQPDLIKREEPNPANGVPIEGLAAWHDFIPSGAAYSSGAHLAIVEVDVETGEIHVLKYIAVDDCGRILNHYLTEAQIHGSLAQGIGQALYEEIVYDQEGQLLSGTLMDYALPIAELVPDFATDFIETPSPHNPLGAKGVGEAGCVGAPPAIVNAVLDALSPLGIKTIDMPLRPEKIWELIQTAQ